MHGYRNSASDPWRDLTSMEAEYSLGGHSTQALMGSAMGYGRWERPVEMVMGSSVLS